MPTLSKEEITSTIEQVFKERVKEKTGVMLEEVDRDIKLLDSGLDSLGFAIMVTYLEDELGYDPFSAAEEAFYPQTFQDFVEFYYKNQP